MRIVTSRLRHLVWAALLAGVATTSCAEPPANQLQARIAAELEAWDREMSPGAAVVVMRGGDIIAQHSVGMANLEHNAPITIDTVFHAASDAKRFTAAAICRLAALGKLKLDDRVSAYVPEMKPLGDPITIEQLLAHSSGLRDQWSLLAMAGWRREDIVTHQQALSLIVGQRSTHFEPGQMQMYSNSGYTLLAEIVSRVAGEPFAQHVQRQFFEKAGMSRTHLRAAIRDIVPGRAESYIRDDSGSLVRQPVQYEVLGATALLTTARDLGRWTAAVHDGKALSPQVLEMMLRRRRLPDGELMTYAFGLHQHDVHGRVAIGHGGADGGFRSYLLRVPDDKLGIAVLTNTPEIEPNGLAHRIAGWALGVEDQPAEATDDDEAPEPQSGPEIDPLVGSYRDATGRVMTVRRYFDRVRLWESASGSADFSWNPERSAFVDDRDRAFTCEGTGCRVEGEAGTFSGQRVAPPTAEGLKQYAGVYHSPELGSAYTLSVKDDHLVAHSMRGQPIELTPTGLDFFDGSAWYAGEVRFTRTGDGKIEAMLMSSGRAFDVPFKRMN